MKKLISILLSAAMLLTLTTGLDLTAYADENYEKFLYQGHYYQIIEKNQDNFFSAEKYCESLGGHLAVIQSSEEDKAVYNYIVLCGVDSAFLGMYENIYGEWVDVYGNQLEYLNWASGEPNNYDGVDEKYINYFTDYPDGTWNDSRWDEPYCNYYICEWDNNLISTPKETSIKRLKTGKKKITVQWKKVSGIKGYQVQVATNSEFTKNKKTVTVKKSKTTKTTIKKLKSNKKYYVRIRTYKVVDGKKVYSKWSKVKTVKTK